MNAATEFDMGPLTWVKGEIDLSLQRAVEAIDLFEQGGDTTQLKFCRTHVHQVHGALSIVGLDGITLVSESLEALLLAMEDGRATGDKAPAVRAALLGLRRYLDELVAGEPNQPLRLLPVYQQLAAARGLAAAHPGDLFFPDLNLRPPKRAGAAAPADAAQAKLAFKAERMRFQKGLLSWLKKPAEAESGRQMMRDALQAIEGMQRTPSTRSFWWVAAALMETLANPQLASDPYVRQLVSRIDAQIRRLLEGSTSIAERLMREALYYIAHAAPELAPAIARAHETWALSALLPKQGPEALQPEQEAGLRKLRELLAGVEEAWNKFCTGNAASLQAFADNTRACAQLTDELGQTDLKRLGQALNALASWLVEDAGRYNDTVAMEVATAILLIQNAQENFRRLGTDFAQQVDLMVDRLYACIAGRPAADTEVPLLDEMTRRAQEKLLIGQVGREMQNNLAQIEQSLDAYFRDPSKVPDVAQIDGQIKQVGGALAMLGHFGAVNSLKECGSRIRAFAEAETPPDDAEFEAVAHQLSLIGFFIDALQTGESDFDSFMRRMEGKDEPVLEEEEEETLPEMTVEAQLAKQTQEAQALVEALKETPQDERLQGELMQNLQAIQKDADLVADRALGESAKAAIEALQAGGDLDLTMPGLAPVQPEAPAPSAETIQLAESSHEEIDAELLAIFLEEAKEVLVTIGDEKALLALNPSNSEALTTVRRSTHTLKGSGRMVGLTALGEVAWELEQTLNLWLRQEQPASAELLRMIDEEHAIFSVWVEHLESGAGQVPDTHALVALAQKLRGVEPSATPEPVAVVVPEAAPAVEAMEEPASLAAIEIELPEPETPLEAPVETLEIPALALEEPALVEEPASELEHAAAALEDLLSLDEPAPEDETIEAIELVEVPELPAVEEEMPASEPLAEPAAVTLFDIFREEARGHLQSLSEGYAQMDAHPVAPTTFQMTRAAHTLGGIAATVGLMPLHHLAIALEHALLRRDGSANPASIEGLETVRQAIITLEGMYATLSEETPPAEQPQLVAALEEIFPPPSVVEEEVASAEVIPLHPVVPEPVPTPEVESAPAPVAQLPQLTDELDEQLLPIFLEEAADQLRDLNEQLRIWRGDPAGDAATHAICRLLHTFKGNARMAGAMNLGEVTHMLETRVEEAMRAGPASGSLIDEIEAGYDTLAQAVEILRNGPPPEPEPITQVIESSAIAEEQPIAAPSAKPAVQADVVPEAEVATAQQASLRVRADLVDRLVNEAGELSIARARIEGEMRSLKSSLLDLTENVIRLRRQLRDIEIQAETQIQARVAQSSEGMAEFDPLELDRFTRFQELTRFMAESVNDVATVQQNLLKNLDDANAAILAQARINRGLQQELMGVRMIPFASQTERFYRIVRQTAKEVGKRANLDVIGGQVDIDRSVLDKMMGPIEHMLRNAVTHGIETREQRQAAGKSEVGEISLALAQEGNEFILSMKDDGKGLDAGRIRVRAEELGLLQPGQQVEDSALYDFIFHPGFSTASELTQLAGRGIGMDVVKTSVTELGGRIEIVTTPGQGTTFRLYLPLTLAVTQTLLVRVGSQMYAIPSTMIEQVMELKEKGLAAIREQGAAEWQGNTYPFAYLPHLLGDSEALPEAHRQHWVLLLRSGSQRVGVQVDELKGNQEVVVKNIGAQLARVVGIAGATVLGDGRVVLILNPVALASRGPVAASYEARPSNLPAAPAVEEHLPTVMVVDDSLTVRKITSRLLSREGYQVVLAKDGVDALEQLIDERPDVILSDIEMPRMDGFDFVRNLRADERLRNIPVIMITSRTADKHRNYALEIGANHYLGKPYDEDQLLGLIAGYVKQKAAV